MVKRTQKHRPREDQPQKPSTDDQSGSTGRRTDTAEDGQDKDTGQDHYGQSGFAGDVKKHDQPPHTPPKRH